MRPPERLICSDVINFFRVTPHLQAAALATGRVTMLSGRAAIESLREGQIPSAIGLAGISVLGVLTVLDIELSAFKNYDAYMRLRKIFERRGFSAPIANCMTDTFCEMFATRQAARDAGFGKEIKNLYKGRWRTG